MKTVKSFWRKGFFRRRQRHDITKVETLYSAFIRGRTNQLKQQSIQEKLRTNPYFNVGCGANVTPGFINIDYYWRPGVDVCWDIRKGIPASDNSLQGIFTEHTLEHITFAQCQAVLTDFFRILQPGTTVRIVVPDAELYIDLYQRSQAGEPVEFPNVSPDEWKKGFTPLMSVNRAFRGYDHRYAYDAETLNMMLSACGFVDIRKEAFMYGRNPYLLIDSRSRADESLYIEASRQGGKID
jgi:predicted SAM-dependent methyltransferase